MLHPGWSALDKEAQDIAVGLGELDQAGTVH